MKRKTRDRFLKILLLAASLLTAGVLLWILGFVIMGGIGHLSPSFLASLAPQFVSTLWMVAGSLAISVPIGIGSAICLNEYAKPGKIVEAIRFSIECLAGIPSIIYGLFGMVFFGIAWHLGFALLTGMLTLSVMVLPTLIRTTEEALKTVPDAYREGSLALGAGKLRTTLKVVLPSALPGVITASILSMGRIVGETAAVYLTAGTFSKMPSGILSSGRTLSVHLYLTAKEAVTPDAFHETYATALVLILLVLGINLLVKLASRKRRV